MEPTKKETTLAVEESENAMGLNYMADSSDA